MPNQAKSETELSYDTFDGRDEEEATVSPMFSSTNASSPNNSEKMINDCVEDLIQHENLSKTQATEKMNMIKKYLRQDIGKDLKTLQGHFLTRLAADKTKKNDKKGNSKSERALKVFKKRILETPQSVSNAIWISLKDKFDRLDKKGVPLEDNKYYQLMKKIYLEDMFHSPPPNVNREFWNSLDKTQPELKIILWEEELDRTHHIAGIWKLIGMYNYHGDYENAVSAMALMDALLLTITFTVAQCLGTDFQDNLEKTINNCPGGVAFGGWSYKGTFEYLQRSLAASFFANICALILATGYFVFKPSSEEKIPLRRMRRQGAMVCAIFVCSFASVVATDSLAAAMLNYYTVTNSRICDYDGRYLYFVGIAATIFAFVFTLAMTAR